MPLVRELLMKKARSFNPNSADVEVEICAICLEQFREDDGKLIAELNCNSKHIFHVNCLYEWVDKNDVCPMCREPIVQRGSDDFDEFDE